MKPWRDKVRAGQESVWDYPRPPALERSDRHIVIEHRGRVIADTRGAFRVLETSHPPTYYLPPSDIARGVLRPARGSSWCEWKGQATYWDVVVGDAVLERVAWSYPQPMARFAALRDHVAFYAAPFDRCLVDDMVATPQPGGFYGGWVTPDLAGPFKGIPGSQGW